MLSTIERLGNRLPDPAMLFVWLLLVVWLASWLLAGIDWGVVDPRNGDALTVNNQLTGPALTSFLSNVVPVFAQFHPVGVVLVAMLGIGVAERTGFIHAGLRGLLAITAPRLLTPMLILVAIASHSAADAGYVLVIPLGGVLFYAAGRHPLAGIGAAFAGVSGGYSANFLPSSLDPMLAGLTQAAGQLIEPDLVINPLNNYFFTAASCLLIVGLGWWITDRIVEPRLRDTPVDGDTQDLPQLTPLAALEKRALAIAGVVMLVGIVLLTLTTLPADSSWRGPAGGLTEARAPLMTSLVALIFVLFLLPGVVYGVVAGTVKSHRDVINGMTWAMQSMAYYLVIMFFIAQFIAAFGSSNLGVLLALKGAQALQALAMPAAVTVVGMVLLTGLLNLFVGSASAKWALMGPVLVPMLMQLGISPDLTQAAYRIGDSSTNIITPLMPYFPLIVVFCQRYMRGTGIGTLTALMLPYAATFLLVWTLFLLLYWGAGLPLGF